MKNALLAFATVWIFVQPVGYLAQHSAHPETSKCTHQSSLTEKDFEGDFHFKDVSYKDIRQAISQHINREFIQNKLNLDVNWKNNSNEVRDIVSLIARERNDFLNEMAERMKNGTITNRSMAEKFGNDFIDALRRTILSGNYDKTPSPATNRVLNGPCVNMDFEEGNTNGWELFRGRNYNDAVYSFTNQTAAAPGAYHQIMNAGQMDPVIAGLPAVNPDGGTHSIRIGNGNISSGGGTCLPSCYGDAAMIRQSFLVTPENAVFTFSYAVVLESPIGHGSNEFPYFFLRVFDENGNEADCGSYFVNSSSGGSSDFIVGGQNASGEDILYIPWTTAFSPLDNYIGQNVTVEFYSADCSQAGHYGYAYVDASCNSLQVSSSSDFICGTEPVTLFGPPNATSYTWNTGETSQDIVINDPGSYNVNVVPVQGAQCSVTLSIDIDGAPNPVADFSASPLLICAGNDITFTDNSTVSEGSIATWSWNFGDGISTSPGSGDVTGVTNTTGTFAIPVHVYDNPGDYTVELTVTTDGGCSNSTTIQITVQDAPTIGAGPDQFLCSGDTFTPQGEGGVNYTWDSGLTNGQGIEVEAGQFTYTVTGFDAIGCSSTATVTIFVDESPVLDAGLNQAICIGEEVTLSGSGAPTYTWTGGITDGVPFSPTETTVYEVSYTSPNGCTGTDQVTVTVNSLPVIDGNDVTVCAGQNIVLNGTGGVSYEWSDDVVNGQPFTQDPGTQNYTVTGTDANGCVNTGTVTVTVNDYPNAAFTVDPQTGMPPMEVTITNETTGNATSYYWNFGNGNESNDGFISTNQTYFNPGNPIIILIVSNNGCADTATVTLSIAYPPMEYEVPNVITANGDGNNDIYHLSLVNAAEVEMIIVNRWGNVMAEIYDVNGGWDGRSQNGSLAAEGVYFVKYKITALNGEVVEGHTFFHLFH
jgi:gliding motility-associated-like protein